jgi:catechol 2,3-dioxygenase-like lactoylglutathione lyase family enzyme
MSFDPATHDWKPLVPELIVSDLQLSLRFWRDLLGFRVLYERPAEGFAYLEREGAEVMLETLSERSWLVDDLERPFGRGVNLQLETTALTPMLEALARAQWPLYRQPEEPGTAPTSAKPGSDSSWFKTLTATCCASPRASASARSAPSSERKRVSPYHPPRHRQAAAASAARCPPDA